LDGFFNSPYSHLALSEPKKCVLRLAVIRGGCVTWRSNDCADTSIYLNLVLF
jgi:hypothetical protein